jgi:hypothetical protein
MIRQLWDSDAHGSFHESGSMFDFRAGGLSTSSNQLYINIVINVNIYVHEVFIVRMGHAHPQSETQFCVTTDRYAAVI